jgi:Protein of unknown function (DUF2862)
MKVGQRVRIRAIQDKVAPEFALKVGEVGIIKEPKIVDGGMGYVVTFNDNVTTWFFHDELEEVA